MEKKEQNQNIVKTHENILANFADIFYRTQISKTIHYLISEKLILYQKIFGLINIFLSALSTAGIVTLIGEYNLLLQNTATIKFIIFCIAFCNTFFASLILYRSDGEHSNIHKIRGDLYLELRDSVIDLYSKYINKIIDLENTHFELSKMRSQLDQFGRSSPQTDKKSYIKAKKRNPKKDIIIKSLQNGSFPYVNSEI